MPIRDFVNTSFVVVHAGWTAGKARRFLAGFEVAYVVVRRTEPAEYYYLYHLEELRQRLGDDEDRPLVEALDLHETESCPVLPPDSDELPYYAVVVEDGTVTGVFDASTAFEAQAVPSAPEEAPPTEAAPEEAFDAYPRLDAPARVAPEETFDVTVGFRAERDAALEEVQPIHIEAPPPDAVVLVFLTAEGATVEGESFARLPLVMDAAHTFTCAAEEGAGEVILKVQYFYDNQLVGGARRSVAVTADGDSPRLDHLGGDNPCRLSPPASEHGVDLTLTVLRRSETQLEWTLVAPNPEIQAGALVTDVGDTREFADQLDDSLRPRQFKGRWAGRALRNVGQTVADVMPPEVFEALREVQDAIGRTPTVLLLTDEPYVPWELAVMPAPLLDDAAHPFLGAQAIVGRWWLDNNVVYPPAVTLDVQRVTAVASKYGLASGQRELKEAIAEQQWLQQTYEAVPLEATLDELATVVFGARLPGHVIHFAVHGYSKAEANAQAIILADGETISAGELVGDYRCGQVPNFAFVFLNACQVGTAGSALGQAAGFPGGLIRGGAQGFVAPLWEVHDEVARDLATAFYRATLEDDAPVAEALYAQRKTYSDEGSTTPMAYIFYGHPNLRLERQMMNDE